MSLESIQSSLNGQRALAGNVSASNDPTQWQHDGNELLIKGAELAAAGKTLGLSEEETLAATSREYRRQKQREAYRTRERRQAEWEQKQKTLVDEGFVIDSPDTDLEGMDELDALIGGTDYEMGLRDLDEDNFQEKPEYRPEKRGVRRYSDGRTESISNPVREQESIFYNPEVAPKSALVDALSRLQAGAEEFGYDATPGSADAAGRLEAQIQPDYGADASLGRETARRDSARFDPEVREYNDNRADAEAQAIARELFTRGGRGAIADGNIARIGDIHSIGKVYEETHKVRSANDAIQGQVSRRHDGVFIDPRTGDTVAVQGPELPPVLSGDRTPNNTGTADNLNAPQTAREWLASSLGQTLDASAMRDTDQIPQVDITTETANFANKVRDFYKKVGLQQSSTVPTNIRSVEELQRVVDRIVGATGGNLTMPNPEKPGTQIPAGRNQVEGAFNALGLTLGEQRSFGQAMYQLDAARRSSVNQNPTGVYLARQNGPAEGVVFDAGVDMVKGLGKTPVARIPKGSTIGVAVPGSDKPQRRSIVAQLEQLEGRDAQMPFMGQVQGEKPRVNRMRPGGMGEGAELEENIARQAESRAKGKSVDRERVKQNQVKARLVEEREKRDAAKRQEKTELIRRFTPANLRQAGRYS